jgi:SAM-dependent methyltransferase
MKSINHYYDMQLTPKEIEEKRHRSLVGGLWEEIGSLQLRFLRANGLQPQHKLLDLGCGALRGGLHLIRFLDRGNYYGIDLNASLIQAGQSELKEAGLADRQAQILVNECFDSTSFNVKFDFALSVSLFTHLDTNHIARCLVEVARTLRPEGVYFSTFFQSPHPAYLDRITHLPDGPTTQFDCDPYHLAFEEIQWLGSNAGLECELIGNWNHPRNQQMVAFSHQRKISVSTRGKKVENSLFLQGPSRPSNKLNAILCQSIFSSTTRRRVPNRAGKNSRNLSTLRTAGRRERGQKQGLLKPPESTYDSAQNVLHRSRFHR